MNSAAKNIKKKKNISHCEIACEGSDHNFAISFPNKKKKPKTTKRKRVVLKLISIISPSLSFINYSKENSINVNIMFLTCRMFA